MYLRDENFGAFMCEGYDSGAFYLRSDDFGAFMCEG